MKTFHIFSLLLLVHGLTFAAESPPPLDCDTRLEQASSLTPSEWYEVAAHISPLYARLDLAQPQLQRLSTLFDSWATRADDALHLYSRKFFAAHAASMRKLAAEGLPRDPTAALQELQATQDAGPAPYKGTNHALTALGQFLYHHAAARYTSTHEPDWLFVAAEAQYQVSKSGTEQFRAFLKATADRPPNDPLVQRARERLHFAEIVDDGLSKQREEK